MIYKLLIIASAMYFYYLGSNINKEFKWIMGIPIGLLGCLYLHAWYPLLCVISYYVATQFGYGENNWLTKLVGKNWAVIIVGTLLGLASFPMLWWFAVVQGIISGWGFGFIHVLDDNDKIKEPYVSLLRGLVGTICFLLLGS